MTSVRPLQARVRKHSRGILEAAAVLAGEHHVHLLDARRRPRADRAHPCRDAAARIAARPARRRPGRARPRTASTSTSSPPRRASPPYSPCGITTALRACCGVSPPRSHSEWITILAAQRRISRVRARIGARAALEGVVRGVHERPPGRPQQQRQQRSQRRPLLALEVHRRRSCGRGRRPRSPRRGGPSPLSGRARCRRRASRPRALSTADVGEDAVDDHAGSARGGMVAPGGEVDHEALARERPRKRARRTP